MNFELIVLYSEFKLIIYLNNGNMTLIRANQYEFVRFDECKIYKILDNSWFLIIQCYVLTF